jgi:TolB-like protein
VSTSNLPAQLQTALGGAYTVERELGGGGMSRVFLASDVSLGRRIVVKLLPVELAGDVSVARFHREVALAAKLQHPHIVPLLSTGDAGGLPYYMMPFVDGETLRARLARDGELPVGDAVRLLREIATALSYAHEKGIVHRDIKPENILLTGGIALVTDFGVAKALVDATTVGNGALTTAGLAIGTPAYMSPEQVSADPGIDHRADLYSFGVVAYEMLTGQPPFTGRTTQALLAAHVVETPESVATRRSALPFPLATLVMRCLEKRPADRPQDAAEIVRALDALTTPSSTASSTPLREPNAERRWLRGRVAAAAAVTVVAAIAVAGWFAFGRGARATATPAARSSRLLVAPFENLTGDPRFDYIGRIAADRLTSGIAQNGSVDVVPANVVLMALRDTTGGRAERLQRLSDATHAGLLASGSVLLRRDSLVLQAQVTDVTSGKIAVTLEPVTGSAADPIAAVDALGDRLLGALGVRRELTILPQGIRPPRYAAYRELSAGFQRFAELGDNLGSRPFFERAIALDSTYTQAYQLLARQYINAGEFERADSMMQRITRLPGGLTATERLQWEYSKAELDGDLQRLLRTAQQLVTRDSSALALFLAGEAGTMLLMPRISVPAIRAAQPTYGVMGGRGALRLNTVLAEAEHQAGTHDRELATLVATQRTFASREPLLRGLRLRAYAGLRDATSGIALADSMLRDATDSSGDAVTRVLTGAQEFRAHGDAGTATRLLAMGREWYRRAPVRAPLPDRQLSEGIMALMSGQPDSAAVRFAAVARDTTRIDAAGYLALAAVARGDGARARAIADSLGAIRRPWLFGVATFWRAAITGALGDRPLAIQLLRQANAQGQRMDTWHYTAALDSLRGYAPFQALIAPQR